MTSVAIDSRDVVPGALFVALPGRTDRRRHGSSEAFSNGAAGVLVRDGLDVDGPAVSVRSTGEALMMLAATSGRGWTPTVVAVTGANGKTSTKDMAAAVLATSVPNAREQRRRSTTRSGFRSRSWGSPADAEVVVAEMGARRVGDVAMLCGIARPDIAIVTNVGVAHLEVFGSWDAIVEASAEPVEALGPDGIAVLNADDPIVAAYAGRTRGRVVTFGLGADADVRAEDVALGTDGRASFTLVRRGRARARNARRPRRAHGVERAGRRGGRPHARGAARRVRRGACRTPPCRLGGWRRSRRRTAFGSSTTHTTRTPSRWRPRCAPLVGWRARAT